MGTAATLVLADVSSSTTAEPHRLLRQKLVRLWPTLRGAKLLAFGSDVTECSGPEDLPEATGSTALHLALEHAAKFMPLEVLVISDGMPDDEERALQAVEGIRGVVQAIFIGVMVNRSVMCNRCGCAVLENRSVIEFKAGSLTTRHDEPIDPCTTCQDSLVSWLRSG